ncbi:MAG: hypothetical protein A2144_10985 [Chloroflexi bacterium RBG_16_50_9]|nr:MAG: hypothetical protein A2144_10985 [Chloroflexi bacterium RBG_16_50_9]
MQINLRLRIFLWYSLIILVIILGLAFAAQQVLVEGLRTSIDQHLKERTEIVTNAIMSGPKLSEEAYDPLIEWLTEQELPYVPAILRIADPRGKILATFGEIPDPIVSLMDNLLLRPQELEGQFETIGIRGHEALRLYTVSLYDSVTQNTILLIQTGDTLAQVTTAQNQLWRYTLIVGIAGSALAIVVGFFLLRQGFRPLDRILSRVREIGSKNLATKIPEETSPPELQELANTLNGMLERLDTAFKAREIFIAGVSHDLRTPLTVLQGQIDVMLMQPSLGQEDRQSLQKMSTEVRRLTRMTNNLLLSGQLESNPTFTPEEIDLGDLLNEVVREMGALAHGLDLKVSIPEIVVVPGDRDLLKQLVLNVVDNAIKFTPRGGAIELSLNDEDAWAVIEVKDTGQGIPREYLSRITEPFYKVNTRNSGHGGAGLGLAIVKQVVDLHGGQLDIQSQVGVGTKVTVKLPFKHA